VDSSNGLCVYVALDEDKVICAICDILIQLKLGEQIVNGIYGDDTATDPDYRGKGVYSKLLTFLLADLVNYGTYFSYWATEHPILTKSSSNYGSMLFPFSLCHMVKIKDVNKYLKNRDRDVLKNKVGFILLNSANTLTNLFSSNIDTKSNFSISNVKYFDDRIDVFWNRVKDDYNFILVKKQNYLNWRYCANNSDQYHVRLATKGDEVLGYSVLRYMKNDAIPEGLIMDLLALKERPDVANSLIDDALSIFELYGTNSVYCQTIRNHPYKKLLAKRGFVDVSRASKNLIYYNTKDLDFDPKTFSDYSPKSIHFNLY
jgi:hypothetical protein